MTTCKILENEQEINLLRKRGRDIKKEKENMDGRVESVLTSNWLSATLDILLILITWGLDNNR